MRKKRSIAALFFIILLASLLGISYPKIASPKEGEILILTNQSTDLTKTLIHAIDSAKESIILSIYSLSDMLVISALNRKAEEGIEIYLYTDAHATLPSMKTLHKSIKKHLWKVGALMHQKILIIDKNEIYLGSANFTWSSLNIHKNLILAFRNSESAEFLNGHLEGSHDYKREPNPKNNLMVGNQEAEILMFPNKIDAASNVLGLIEGAKKCIKVAMYTWTRCDFAKALSLAKLKGIDVEVVLDRSNEKRAQNPVLDILKNGSISTYIYQGKGLLHHKFLWIDNEILLSGSVNWTKAAFTQNREFTILLSKLTASQKEIMESLWNLLKKESKLL